MAGKGTNQHQARVADRLYGSRSNRQVWPNADLGKILRNSVLRTNRPKRTVARARSATSEAGSQCATSGRSMRLNLVSPVRWRLARDPTKLTIEV